MRRTKVSLLYKKTGNLRACQLLLGHTKLESTVRYLGVEVTMLWSCRRRWNSERPQWVGTDSPPRRSH
jgi:site-specific recombinase XerD